MVMSAHREEPRAGPTRVSQLLSLSSCLCASVSLRTQSLAHHCPLCGWWPSLGVVPVDWRGSCLSCLVTQCARPGRLGAGPDLLPAPSS